MCAAKDTARISLIQERLGLVGEDWAGTAEGIVAMYQKENEGRTMPAAVAAGIKMTA